MSKINITRTCETLLPLLLPLFDRLGHQKNPIDPTASIQIYKDHETLYLRKQWKVTAAVLSFSAKAFTLIPDQESFLHWLK